MARFNIGDEIEFVRTSAGTNRVVEVLQKGIVKTECMRVEDTDHYHVDWYWTSDGIKWKNTTNDLICDLVSKKYQYRHLEK